MKKEIKEYTDSKKCCDNCYYLDGCEIVNAIHDNQLLDVVDFDAWSCSDWSE